jgi:hypothetical protein
MTARTPRTPRTTKRRTASRATADPATPPGGEVTTTESRDPDLLLARLHVRLGSLALARVELETLAASAQLDGDGLVDLAEVRWRTGDLALAAEAATASTASGREDVVTLLISAEAMAELGRPNEARRLAGRALERSEGPIDRVFAGMPRASVWPVDPAAAPPTAGTLFPGEPSGPVGASSGVTHHPALAGSTTGEAALAVASPGLWDTDGGLAGSTFVVPDGAELLEAGRSALDDGELALAALRLGLAIRLSPALAPAVLDLIGPSAGPDLEIVRGDAYRLVGHERDAQRAYAAAAGAARPSDPPGSQRPPPTATDPV